MKALHRMDRYRKEVLQLSTRKHGINVQYLYDRLKMVAFLTASADFYSRPRSCTTP